MSKRIISITVLLAATLIATASEFWLKPKKFHYIVGEEMKLDFREGDAFTGELWDMNKNKAELFQWYSAAGMKDFTKAVKPTRGNNVIIKFQGEGTQLLVMRSNAAYREWSGDQFNAYLEEQEIGEIAELRKRTNSSSDSAKENYTRLAKVLVQVGERIDDTFKKKTGLRLEIIPAKNPYLLKTGDYLPCQILFEGRPLPHVLVKVWSRLNHTTFLQNIYSEKDGTIVFPISTHGTWMVSTVKMTRSEKPPADWQSLWGSLVFGI
jgi:uncharacterized GH25 family protein